jgi:VWFA-related protein
MRTRLALLAVSLAAVAATVTAQARQDRGQPTFRSGANYVRVDMYATRDGQPVDDLKATDVELLEDGVPQKVEDFEHVVVRSATTPAARAEVDGLRGSREAAGDPRARVFVVFLDTYHTQLEGSAIMRKPLAAFLNRVLGPDDLVALMTPEMAGSDIALGRKTDLIEKIVSDEWWGRRARIAGQDPKELLYEQCLPPEDPRPRGQLLMTPVVRGNTLLNEVIGRRREKLTLDALDDLMTHLAGLRDERKAVVLVTEGWLLYEPNPKLADEVRKRTGGPAPPAAFEPPVKPPSDRGSITSARERECEADFNALAAINSDLHFRTITEDANRGNVTFYPVYARGLASFDAPIGPDYPPPIAQDTANLRTRHNNMRTLAVETDGDAIIDTNYIEKGLKRIADDLSSYYLFGYYSTNAKLDGRYRTITVRVRQPGVRVRARRGYRARTADQVVAAAVAAKVDPASTAVTNALNSVVGVNARSTFRVRPTVWMHGQGGTAGGAVWVVGELDFRTLRETAWAAGASGDVLLLSANGDQLASSPVELPAGQGAFSLRVPTASPLAPGDYAVRVRLRGRDASASDTARVTVPDKPSPIGEAALWRRGGSTGPQFVRTADPRFQRSDRLRLEFATDTTGATARLLDRFGKALQVPVQVSERADAESIRWIVADVTLAPLAAGDYAIEVTAGGVTQVTGFRIIP